MKWVKAPLKTLLVTLLLFAVVQWAQWSGMSPHYRGRDHVYAQEVKYQMGDLKDWRLPDFDDSNWPWGIKDSTGVFWVRATLELDSAALAQRPLAMQVEFLASYECYWDGQLLGTNGKVGNSLESEVEGNLLHVLPIPDTLAGKGRHVVAFRASNQRVNSKIRYWGFHIGNFKSVTRTDLQFTALIFTFLGFFLVVGCYYLSIYFIAFRDVTYLIFGLFNLATFALLGMEYWKFFEFYPYSWHYDRLDWIIFLSVLVFGLLISFYLSRFNTKRWWWIGSLGVFFLVILLMSGVGPEFLVGPLDFGPDLALSILALVTFGVCAVIIVVAMIQKRPFSTDALISIVPWLLMIFYYDLMLFLGLANIVFFNLISLSGYLKQQRKEHEASKLRSSQLEAEVLRKNLQPHFILNTLTSLMEWVEKDTHTGVKFIQALADEFRILNEISSQKLIPLTREISLCETHLKVMSYRKGTTYQLMCEGLPKNSMIPPAIFLTLVENGISHSKPTERNISFSLSSSYESGWRVYDFIDQSKMTSSDFGSEGIGTRYIKSRLEESFGSDWEFSHGPSPKGWKTTIKLKE